MGVVVFEGLILVKSTLVKVKVYHSLDFLLIDEIGG